MAESRFGGNGRLASSGDQLRARLGGLVLDYPTELMACSIYRVRERCCLIWMNCTGGREGNESRRWSTVAIAKWLNYGGHWIVTTAHTDAINFLRRGALSVNGEHAGDSRPAMSPVWITEGHRGHSVPVLSAAWSFHRRAQSTDQKHKSWQVAPITTKGHWRRDTLSWRSDQHTVPSHIQFS
jgi:hypothetical protein